MLTVSVITLALDFPATAVVDVQVSVPRMQLQPVPLIAFTVPLTSVSTTVMVPLLAVVPPLLTVSVKTSPVSAGLKVPVCVLATPSLIPDARAAAAFKKFVTSSDPHPVAWS